MAVKSLQHVNIRTTDVQTTVDFYQELLGMRQGERPPVRLPGAWIYCGDDPVVHIIAIDVKAGGE